jgi:hypothetical protein
MKATPDNIYEVLNNVCISGKTVSFLQMMDAINASGMKIKNWLKVRGVLQYMINNNMISRTSDLHVEEYFCA